MQLSKNFSLVELTKSQTAERKGIPNDPSPDHQEHLRLLCARVLQPVRDHFNHVVSVSSGYRSPALCQAIGSSSDSQHAKGMAADFEIYGTPNNEVFNWIKNNHLKHMALRIRDLGGKIDKIYWVLLAVVGTIALQLFQHYLA